MSRKNFLHYPIISNGSMASASLTSAVTNIQRLDNIGIQLSWTSSPSGTFAVQVSADYAQDAEGNVTNSGNWVPLALSPSPATSSGSPIYIDINELSAPWIRVVYTRISGSGTLQATLVGKMI